MNDSNALMVENRVIQFPEPEPEYDCRRCNDVGYLIVDTPGHPLDGKPYPCPDCERGQEYSRQWYAKYVKQSGLPEHYQRMTFATFEKLPKEQRQGKMLGYHAAKLFVERRDHRFTLGDIYKRADPKHSGFKNDVARNSLVLYGAYGVGKTGLAAAIVNSMVGELVLYVRVQDLIRAVQKTYDRDYEGESRDALIWRIKGAPMLVLDEFGLQNISADRNEIMEEIMRYRCGRELPFVATTNDSPDVFRSKWDGRIVEVMLEAAHWIPLDEPVLRNQVQV